jgi:tetratricopeptide (TPR) repeat protein
MTLVALSVGALAEAGWDEGVKAFQAKNYAAASQEFRGVVESRPSFAGGHFMLGQSLLKEGKKQEALTYLRKAYELDSNQVSHAFVLGKAYLDNGRYNEAAQVLAKINPGSLPKEQQPVYHQMKAAALSKAGRSDEAIGALRQLTVSQPNDANAWFNYGAAALSAGETSQAASALERAIRLDANNVKAKEAYITALISQAREPGTSDGAKKGFYAKAVPVAQSLSTASPTFEHLLVLGEVQLGAGQYGDAAGTLSKAVTKSSNDFYAQFYLSQAETSIQKWQEAEGSARKALQLARDDKSKRLAWRQIGFINEKLKQYDEAKTAYVNAGDQGGVRRVEENQRIATENEKIEQENAEIERIRREEERLRKELEELKEGNRPPQR